MKIKPIGEDFHDYRPHSNFYAKFNPAFCRHSVPDSGRSPTFHQCSKKVWKDGYCKVHHPDTEAERRKASQAKWDAQNVQAAASRLQGHLNWLQTLASSHPALSVRDHAQALWELLK